MINKGVWEQLSKELAADNVTLIAVSKLKPASDVQQLYDLGQRDFGENYVQEVSEKQPVLPEDIRWHFIGHLQSNKVKYIASFVHLIHTVDSFKLLAEINKQAQKCGRTIDVLLQMYIANEDTKFGLDEAELTSLVELYTAQKSELQNVRICGLMGMATHTEDEQQVRREFAGLRSYFDKLSNKEFKGHLHFTICSMGMSADHKLAIAAGSTMVRIGSMLFGERNTH
jgi:pyridoxal phosphate enzyme (YggS family)